MGLQCRAEVLLLHAMIVVGHWHGYRWGHVLDVYVHSMLYNLAVLLGAGSPVTFTALAVLLYSM